MISWIKKPLFGQKTCTEESRMNLESYWSI